LNRFFIGPIVILICNYIIDTWARQRIGFITQSCITTIGFIYFLILTYPAKTNENFPFHVTTNRIGIALNNSETQNYPHHDEGQWRS
jgi:uncharacterized membrane protein YesL